MHPELAEAIVYLTHELRESRGQRKIEMEWFKSHFSLATKHDLEQMEKRIMSKISEFADAVEAHNSAVDAAVQGLTDDIANLNKQITDLQNSAGTITPEDQARLDAIQARSQSVADKLASLDALTPPVTPPTP